MKHNDLVVIGSKWLKKHSHNIIIPNCYLVANETPGIKYNGEIPDIIGWSSTLSVLIEVKVNRSDFLTDKKKPHRVMPYTGMGELRYYLCPEGLIKQNELPVNWGLLFINDLGEITIQHTANKQLCNALAERSLLYSIAIKK